MNTVFGRRIWRRVGLAAALGLAALGGVAPAQAAPWNNRTQWAAPAFRSVWQASDEAVASGRVARSYTWGPGPWWDYKEHYRQSPNGLRQVQYFDKARMELNNPASASERGVTNGLLTVELVSGRVKVGDGTGWDENVSRRPADVPVAGDPLNTNPNAPSYASFAGVATTDNGYRDPDRVGQRVGSVLDKAGNRSTNPDLARDPAAEIVAYNTITGHNVPRVFRDFIQNGPVDGVFAFGYPISDAYWVRARVGGAERDVLVQLFERRVVTYTPANAPAFRVEMGNVGQHYFQWRYPHLGQPWLPDDGPLAELPIAFASKRSSADHWETFAMNQDGGFVRQLSYGDKETVPYSWQRAYAASDGPRLMMDSTRDGGMRRLFSVALRDAADQRAHSISGGPDHIFNAAVSPDGTLIAAVVQAGAASTIGLQDFGRGNNYPSSLLPIETRCVYQSPTWLPDGSGLVYAAACDGGKFAIYRGDLRIDWVGQDGGIAATLVNIRAITSTPTADNYFPRVAPDGARVVFSSNRNGQGDLYLVNVDGTGERRLTNDAGDDGAATWNRDGTRLAFDSNRDGDYDIYVMDLGSALPNAFQLNNNAVDDRWPIWNQ